MDAAGATVPIVPRWTPPTSAPAGCPCSFMHEGPGNSRHLCSRCNTPRHAKTAAPAGSLGTGRFKKKQEPGGAGEGTDRGRAVQWGCQAGTAWGSQAGTGMPSSRQGPQGEVCAGAAAEDLGAGPHQPPGPKEALPHRQITRLIAAHGEHEAKWCSLPHTHCALCRQG